MSVSAHPDERGQNGDQSRVFFRPPEAQVKQHVERLGTLNQHRFFEYQCERVRKKLLPNVLTSTQAMDAETVAAGS